MPWQGSHCAQRLLTAWQCHIAAEGRAALCSILTIAVQVTQLKAMQLQARICQQLAVHS